MAELDRGAIAAAAAAATRALIAAQDARGCWMDFPDVGQGSDEWVTGYIGAALSQVSTDAARLAAVRAWSALSARPRWSGGWGYMPSYPADADSTICALRLVQGLPHHRGSLRAWRARLFVRNHQGADGGISTYKWPRRMMWSTGLRETFAGWCSSHVCVSANAAGVRSLPGRRRLLAFLRARQLADGSWRAYWWHDEHEYATALAAEALAASSNPRDKAAILRAVTWARISSRESPVLKTLVAPCGSAFAVSLRLRVLLLDEDKELRACIRTAVAWLLGEQRADGTWPGSASLRFPPTEVADTTCITEWRLGEMVRAGVMTDTRGLFTTATVLTALLAWQARDGLA